MATVEIQVQGLTEWQARLSAMPAKIERSVIRKSLRSVTTRIARTLKANTPRGIPTPHAADRIRVQVKVNNRRAYGAVSFRKDVAYYMRMREYGAPKHGQPPHPFFNAALGNWRAEVETEFKIALENAVNNAEAALGD